MERDRYVEINSLSGLTLATCILRVKYDRLVSLKIKWKMGVYGVFVMSSLEPFDKSIHELYLLEWSICPKSLPS